MIRVVREDLLKIIDRVLSILPAGDFVALRELSNHTVQNASIFQDSDSISIAVVTYALSKILPKSHLSQKEIYLAFVQMRHALKSEDVESYHEQIIKLFSIIAEMDGKLQLYIEEVIKYAEIKKGIRMYQHGISMARTAEVLGISEWDLARYVGKSSLNEPASVIYEKLNLVRELFGVKR